MTSRARIAVTVLVIVTLVSLPVQGANPIGKAVPRTGTSLLNGTELKLETTIFPGDTLTTNDNGLALVELSQGDQIHLGPASSAAIHRLDQEVAVVLTRGMAAMRSGNASQISVNALGLWVRPTEKALYEVVVEENAVVVASSEGNIEVQGTNRSMIVPAGRTMKFEVSSNPNPGPVGAGSHDISQGAAVGIAVAISVGITIPLAVVIANMQADDEVDELCEFVTAVSPSSTTAQACAQR
ncbi:hypothetical protein MYX77_01955 [Acidobacteriia bacterium AH_259_A11_L15]|nr:hypothetical protein [Acidobacteriia bacterium AH_259_A11_L15]